MPPSVALSFVIPVFKPLEGPLKKCLKSLRAQSLEDWEAIIVLDGPDPAARDLILSLTKKDKRFKIVTVPHGGACAARNAGFSHSTGENVVFWDCDCEIEVHAAKAWVDTFKARPSVDFIYSGYKFMDEQGAINSEPFDPWLLRVRNYITTCSPLRRSKVVTWDVALASLQDWDFWLTVVENGGNGLFLEGYSFSTAMPTKESISGKGCTAEEWLNRVRAVQKKHGISERGVCVTSVSEKLDAIALAKSLEADYQDAPSDKPNPYHTIVQVGFSLNPGVASIHASRWTTQHRKVLYWTRDDVDEINNALSLRTLYEFALRLNPSCVQFVEDLSAKAIMERAGFKVEVAPLPMVNNELLPMPKEPRFLLDVSPAYNHTIDAIMKSLPDVRIDIFRGALKIEDYSGLISFHMDASLSSTVKRMLLNGRQVISNIKNPFCGYTTDRTTDELFVKSVVERVRKVKGLGPNDRAVDYWRKALSPEALLNLIKPAETHQEAAANADATKPQAPA